MVKEKYTASEIKKVVNDLVAALKIHKVAVDKIILYGSYAKGTPRAHSDIDIAVISPQFKRKKKLETQAKLAQILSPYLSVVEVVGYSTDDFKKAEPESFIGEIKRTGKVLYRA